MFHRREYRDGRGRLFERLSAIAAVTRIRGAASRISLDAYKRMMASG